METAIRKNFGKLTEAIEPPNLLQNQVDSFHDFLQREVPSTHRKKLVWRQFSVRYFQL